MKLSIMLFPFHSQLLNDSLTAEELIGTLCEAGAQGFETMHSFEKSQPEKWNMLIQAIRSTGFPIVCHDIGINMIGTEEDREQRLEEIRDNIRFTRSALDCDRVLLYDNRQVPGMSDDDAREIFAQNLKRMADFAHTLGITATIEDFDPTPDLACTAEHCRFIVEKAAPYAGLCFDTGNFPAAFQRPTDIFSSVAHIIRHVHIKDRRFVPDATAKTWEIGPSIIGEGDIHIDTVIGMLKDSGYDGYLSAEIAGNKLEDAVTALHNLKAWL